MHGLDILRMEPARIRGKDRRPQHEATRPIGSNAPSAAIPSIAFVRWLPMTALWKYNRITGSWVKQRDCQADTSSQWLARFQADEPRESFKLGKRRPRGKP